MAACKKSIHLSVQGMVAVLHSVKETVSMFAVKAMRRRVEGIPGVCASGYLVGMLTHYRPQ